MHKNIYSYDKVITKSNINVPCGEEYFCSEFIVNYNIPFFIELKVTIILLKFLLRIPEQIFIIISNFFYR